MTSAALACYVGIGASMLTSSSMGQAPMPRVPPAGASQFNGDAGTLSVWVKPLRNDPRGATRDTVSFNWSVPGRDLVVSQTRTHDPRFFVRLDAHRDLACSPRFRFPYTFFLPGEWTQLVVTWQSGNPGISRWYVDGKILCEAGANFSPQQRGSTEPGEGDGGGLQVDRVATAERAWSAEEVHRSYQRNGGDPRAKWAIALAAERLDPSVVRGAAAERRVMQDEDTHWAVSKSEISRRLQRLQAAGFNVYMPLVWNGAQMFCVSAVAPMSPAIRDPLDPDYDPLNYLIAEAHKRGIDVQPWIYVVGRQPGEGFPPAFVDGSPSGAFNVHSREFRDYIVALAVDIAKRHDIDGLNLDYIRAVGPCTNAACLDAYRQKYGRSLADDWKVSAQGTSVPSLVEFNRTAVTDIVVRIAAGVRAERPRAVLTVDSILFDYSRSQQGLDEEDWIKRGAIDAVMNMSYDDPVDVDSLDRANSTLGARRLVVTFRNYDIFGVDVVDRSGAAMADYIRMVRSRWPGAGVGVYHYMHMDSNQLAGFSDMFSPASAAARAD